MIECLQPKYGVAAISTFFEPRTTETATTGFAGFLVGAAFAACAWRREFTGVVIVGTN